MSFLLHQDFSVQLIYSIKRFCIHLKTQNQSRRFIIKFTIAIAMFLSNPYNNKTHKISNVFNIKQQFAIQSEDKYYQQSSCRAMTLPSWWTVHLPSVQLFFPRMANTLRHINVNQRWMKQHYNSSIWFIRFIADTKRLCGLFWFQYYSHWETDKFYYFFHNSSLCISVLLII